MDNVGAFINATRDAGEVVFTSRIRFLMSPASGDLADRLQAAGHAQVLFEHPESPERLVVWPLSRDVAIMEMTHRGPEAEAFRVKFAHEMHAQAQVRVLRALAGSAEVVPPNEFVATDLRRTGAEPTSKAE